MNKENDNYKNSKSSQLNTECLYKKYCKYKTKYNLEKKYLESLDSLTGGKGYKNKIILDLEDLKVFKQVNDLCWLHSSLTILFFSDCFRDHVWNNCFYIKKLESKKTIPTKIRFTLNSNNSSFEIFFWNFLMEIIKNVIQSSINKIDIVEISRKCNLLLQNLICKDLLKDNQKLKKMCDYNTFGGYPLEFIHNMLDFYNLSRKFKISHLIEWDRSLIDLSLMTGIQVIIIFTKTHVNSFLKINKKWCFYDNESSKILVDLEINNPNVLNDLLEKHYKIYKYYMNIHSIVTIKRKSFVKSPLINYDSETISNDNLEVYLNEIQKNGLVDDLIIKRKIDDILIYNLKLFIENDFLFSILRSNKEKEKKYYLDKITEALFNKNKLKSYNVNLKIKLADYLKENEPST